MRFTAQLQAHGKTATGFVVPEEIVDRLGAGRRPKVTVTIRGHTYRSSIASMGGRMLLGVSAENREAAGVRAGDVLDVDVEVDSEERTVEVPEAMAAAMAGDDKVRAFYDSLSYSQKQTFALSVRDAKTDETRQRRVDKAISALREGRKRP
ncbi:MAG: YdeI/OmpD-associated family protein [Actinomycetota bacterium]|nr:YdeI/OmpD-associated family protein [Actinomycetota bacterium]